MGPYVVVTKWPLVPIWQAYSGENLRRTKFAFSRERAIEKAKQVKSPKPRGEWINL